MFMSSINQSSYLKKDYIMLWPLMQYLKKKSKHLSSKAILDY